MGKMVDSDKLRVLRKMASNKEDMLSKKGLENLKTIQRYAGRGEISPVPKSVAQTGLKALGEASDEVADKVAKTLSNESAEAIAKQGGKSLLKNLPKAASIAAGPAALLASGAAEAFDAGSVGEDSDIVNPEDMKEQINRFREEGLVKESSPEDMDRKRRIARRILDKKKNKEARREDFMESDLSPEVQKMVEDIKVQEELARYKKDSGIREALQSAADNSQTEDMKQKYLRMLRRRGR